MGHQSKLLLMEKHHHDAIPQDNGKVGLFVAVEVAAGQSVDRSAYAKRSCRRGLTGVIHCGKNSATPLPPAPVFAPPARERESGASASVRVWK